MIWISGVVMVEHIDGYNKWSRFANAQVMGTLASGKRTKLQL